MLCIFIDLKARMDHNLELNVPTFFFRFDMCVITGDVDIYISTFGF
jgi:hypothetical protein